MTAKLKNPLRVVLATALVLALSLPGCNSESTPKLTTVPDSTRRPELTTPSGTDNPPSTESTEGNRPSTVPTLPESTTAPTISTNPTAPTVPETEDSSVEIVAVGDNLFHTPLVTAGEKLGYDILYSGIRDVISAADLAILNQETPFTTGSASGYPRFATPTAVGDAAIAAGFDVFSCATNHTWDKGMEGVSTLLDYWGKHPEVTALGLNAEKADRSKLNIVEVDGIRIALFNFGTMTNQKAESWWMVNYIDQSAATKDFVAGLIERARQEADFVIVCAHWGSEYVYTPTAAEISYAQFFADCGVDVVFGTHPHVVQPVMEVEGKDGNKTIVYYSLGNFISNQTNPNTNVGGLARLKLVREDGDVRVQSYELVATTVDCQTIDGVKCYMPRLLSDMTDEMLGTSWKFGDREVAEFVKIFEEASTSYPKKTEA